MAHIRSHIGSVSARRSQARPTLGQSRWPLSAITSVDAVVFMLKLWQAHSMLSGLGPFRGPALVPVADPRPRPGIPRGDPGVAGGDVAVVLVGLASGAASRAVGRSVRCPHIQRPNKSLQRTDTAKVSGL